MKFHRLWIGVILAVLVSASQVFGMSSPDSPAGVVETVYGNSFDHFYGFTPASLKVIRPWLTLGLYDRLLKKVNHRESPNSPPEVEGDVFLDSQEPPTNFEVGRATIEGSKAKVPVTLSFAERKRQYVVMLEQVSGAWKIADVSFGSDGKLTDQL